MPWIIRCTSDAGDGRPPTTDPIDDHPVLVSALWDLGTTGVAGHGADLLAGFDDLDTAHEAVRLAAGHGMTGAVEPVNEDWARHEPTTVSITTPTGTSTFEVVAGAAFGHGAHPTTRLCLDLLAGTVDSIGSTRAAADDRDGLRLLDLGTGSGVLALAARLLGVDHVTACDIDRTAIDAARFNLEDNGVKAALIHGDIDVVAGGLDPGAPDFDVIVANVLPVVHERSAETVVSMLGPGGALVLSGFLDHQTDRVVDAYRRWRPNLEVELRTGTDDWSAVILSERSSTA